jgi:hypothetical protein
MTRPLVIRLTQNKCTLVDEEDADLSDIKWYAHFVKNPNELHGQWYVDGHGPTKNGRRETIRLHRMILERMLGRPLKSSEHVDHINHDSLDNRRANLRLVTCQQNQFNQRPRSGIKSSKYKGVAWRKREQKWIAQIGCNYIRYSLGYFTTEEDAARAYDKAAKRLFGESFYTPNFLDDEIDTRLNGGQA